MWKLLKLSLLLAASYIAKIKLENPIKKNTFQLPEDKLSESCPNFDIAYGNFSTAKILLLGENHLRNTETIQCVKALTKDIPHDLYLEGVEYNNVLPCDAIFNINTFSYYENAPNRVCKGWDDMQEHAKLGKVFNDLEFKNNLFMKRPLENDGKSFLQKLNDLQQERIDAITIIQTGHRKRNESLLKALKNRDKNRLAVVIAGRDHLVEPDNMLARYSAGGSYVQSQLESNKDENPFVVLAMKI